MGKLTRGEPIPPALAITGPSLFSNGWSFTRYSYPTLGLPLRASTASDDHTLHVATQRHRAGELATVENSNITGVGECGETVEDRRELQLVLRSKQ